MLGRVALRVALLIAGFVLVATGVLYAVMAFDLLELLGGLIATCCGVLLVNRALDGEVDDE